jgi:hypothetical protein
MTWLVFIPVDRADAVGLRAGTDLGARPGCAPTAGVAGSLEADPVVEEAEFAALNQAGVLALGTCTGPLRLVLAVDVADDQVTDRENASGEVTVTGLRWPQVEALFADESAAAPAVARARAQLAAVGSADAGEIEALASLQDEFDLLWFAPDELDQLPG